MKRFVKVTMVALLCCLTLLNVFLLAESARCWHRKMDALSKSADRFLEEHHMISSPALAGNRLFFGSWDRGVYAVDTDGGTCLWRFEAPAPVTSSPAVKDGMVYVGTGACGFGQPGAFVALDVATGAKKWEYKTERIIVSSVSLSGTTAFFGCKDRNIHAIDIRTGEGLWKFPTGGWVTCAPALSDRTAYGGDTSGTLYALDCATASVSWKFCSEGIWRSPLVSGNVVYIGTARGNLYALDRERGTEKWRHNAGSAIETSPVAADGAVYFGNADGLMLALDAETGKERWSFKTGGEISSTPVVWEKTLCFGSSDGCFYAVDGETGAATILLRLV